MSDIRDGFSIVLKERFPILYESIGKSYREGGAYVTVGLGWYGLLYELGTKIEPILESLPEEERRSVGQIKEKFAGLRFYLRGVPEEVQDIINDVCRKSYKICERCGTKGDLCYLDCWMKTLCEGCHKAKLKEVHYAKDEN